MRFAHASAEFLSFVPCAAYPYLPSVKKEEMRERQIQMSKTNIPSFEELYALEQWARRERAKAQARLFLSAFAAVKALVVRIVRGVARVPAASEIRKQAVNHA